MCFRVSAFVSVRFVAFSRVSCPGLRFVVNIVQLGRSTVYSLDPPLREPAAGGYSHLLASKRRIGGHLHRGKGVTAHLLAHLAASGYLDLLM